MLRKAARIVFTLLVLVLLVGVAGSLYLGWRINSTGAHDQAHTADVIVVLGARVEANGQAGPDLRSRTEHAVSLYRQGLAPYVICTGGFEGDSMSAAAVAQRLAVSLGVPAERVLVADGSMTTGEDAVSTRKLMEERGWQTAILVSHPLHLERARLLFESQGLTVYPSPTSTELGSIPWRTRVWLTMREVVGIVWIGLAEIGVPYEWTTPISRWVYDLEPAPGASQP